MQSDVIEEKIYPDLNPHLPSAYVWPEGPDKHVIKRSLGRAVEEYDIINGERCEWVAEVNECWTYRCINEWLPEAKTHATYSLGYVQRKGPGSYQAEYIDLTRFGETKKIGSFQSLKDAKAAVVLEIRTINDAWNRAGRPK